MILPIALAFIVGVIFGAFIVARFSKPLPPGDDQATINDLTAKLKRQNDALDEANRKQQQQPKGRM